MPEALRDHAEIYAVSDEQLMVQITQGDGESFEELVRRYSPPLYAYIRKLILNDADADDLLQETFLSVWKNADQFHQGKRVKPWLYSIAHHKVIDKQRSHSRRKERQPPEIFDEEGRTCTVLDVIPDRSEEHVSNFPDHMIAKVRQAVTTLTSAQYSSLHMAYWQELRNQQIADILDIPMGTVKSRLYSGLNRLRRSMNTTA